MTKQGLPQNAAGPEIMARMLHKIAKTAAALRPSRKEERKNEKDEVFTYSITASYEEKKGVNIKYVLSCNKKLL